MARVLELDELVEHFTLLADEQALLRNKFGATRLGFALLLKFFVRAGRFPSGRSELADEVVGFVAGQVGVPASELGFYDWSGHTIKAHRAEVRRVLGFRECSTEDAEKLTGWLGAEVAEAERRPELVREALLVRCRTERIESPSPARVQRIVAAALHRAEDTLFDRISGRLSAVQAGAVRDLIDAPAGELGGALDLDEHDAGGSGGRTTAARVGLAGPQLLGLIRSEPGAVSLESMLTEIWGEIDKLLAIGQIDLPDGLFDDVAPRVLTGWRGQAMVEFPSHLRAHRQAVHQRVSPAKYSAA